MEAEVVMLPTMIVALGLQVAAMMTAESAGGEAAMNAGMGVMTAHLSLAHVLRESTQRYQQPQQKWPKQPVVVAGVEDRVVPLPEADVLLDYLAPL